MEQQPINTSVQLSVRILSVVGGFLSMLLLLFFFYLSGIVKTVEMQYLFGGSALAVAIVGSRLIRRVFMETSFITLYMAGCILCCYAADFPSDFSLLLALFVTLVTLLFARGTFLLTLGVLLFNAAWVNLLFSNVHGSDVFLFVVWLMGVLFLLLTRYEARLVTLNPMIQRLFRPLHVGFFISFGCGLIGVMKYAEFSDYSAIAFSLFIWATLLFIVFRVMRIMQVNNRRRAIQICVLLLLLLIPTLFVPALSGALLLMLFCFSYGYRAMAGVSLFIFAYTLVMYYYDLELTLLVKSGTLFLTGVLLLLTYYYFTKYPKNHETV